MVAIFTQKCSHVCWHFVHSNKTENAVLFPRPKGRCCNRDADNKKLLRLVIWLILYDTTSVIRRVSVIVRWLKSTLHLPSSHRHTHAHICTHHIHTHQGRLICLLRFPVVIEMCRTTATNMINYLEIIEVDGVRRETRKHQSYKILSIFFCFWCCRCNQWNEGFDFCIGLVKGPLIQYLPHLCFSLSRRSLQHSSSVSTECNKQAIVNVQDAVYESFAKCTLTSISLILLYFQLDLVLCVRFSVYKVDI